MSYLLDVHILVAWGWSDHVDHAKVEAWIAGIMTSAKDKFFTSAIPEVGFVRVSVQRSRGGVTASQAGALLKGMLDILGKRHEFLPDDRDGRTWPSWCQGAARTTDAHLLNLAAAHGLVLATLDTGIPGALVIP